MTKKLYIRKFINLDLNKRLFDLCDFEIQMEFLFFKKKFLVVSLVFRIVLELDNKFFDFKFIIL